jgi:hypothetical protein
MENFLNSVFAVPCKNFLEKLSDFLPNLFTSLVLIIAGLVMAWLVKTILVKVLRFLKVDALSERTGVAQVLGRGGIKDPLSGLTGRLLYWMVLISFIIMGLDALRVPAVNELMKSFFLYLPNVIVSAVVVVFGYIISNFLGRAALIASVNAGVRVSGLIGKLVQYAVFFLSVVMALELLGIGKETVLVAFAIMFGGLVLALAIAFGLGGKEMAKDYIEGKMKEKGERDEIEHV